MFTGLVEAKGTVRSIEPRGPGLRLTIDPGSWNYAPSDGDSISVEGCCLTVVDPRPGAWSFDVVAETIDKTSLSRLAPGSEVNLEKSATPTTLLGGHVVQGHVDGVGEVVHVQTGDDWRVGVRVPPALMAYMIPKGSVCLAGVSLTLARVDVAAHRIEVALIPATLAKTTLASLRVGDRINIEADAMVKTIVHWMTHFASVRGSA